MSVQKMYGHQCADENVRTKIVRTNFTAKADISETTRKSKIKSSRLKRAFLLNCMFLITAYNGYR